MKIDYYDEYKKLEDYYQSNDYFKVISLGVQFIDYLAEKYFENEKDVDILGETDVEEIIDGRKYTIEQWIRLKKDISKRMNYNDSWKYKILSILDLSLNGWLDNIKVTPNLIDKIVRVHKFRNEIQHQWYKKEFENLKSAARDCLDVCKIFESLLKDGLID